MASSVEQVEVSRGCVQDIRHWVYCILRKPSSSPHLPLDYKLHSVFIIRGMNCCKMLNVLPWLYMLRYIWLKTCCGQPTPDPAKQRNITTKKNQPTTTTKIGEFPAIQWLRLKGCCWIMRRHWDSRPPEEKNSTRGQRRGLIAQSFCVIKFY